MIATTSTLSVIIPAFNSGRTIDRCVASVLAQDWPRERVELVIVDNGSTDDTSKLAQRAGAKVVFEPKLGRSAARNRGAREATGELLAFLDADSAAPTDWLTKCAVALRHPWVGASQPLVQKVGRANKKLTSQFVQAHYYVPFLSTCGLVTTRSAFEATRGFDESLARCVDVDFSFRLLVAGYAFAWEPRTTIFAAHDLNYRQAFRRGWIRGEATALLSQKWRHLERISDSRRRLDWLKIWARVTLSDLRHPFLTRGVNAAEELTKAIATFRTDLTTEAPPTDQFRRQTALSSVLGPRRFLVLTPEGGRIFDQERQRVIELTNAETDMLADWVGRVADHRPCADSENSAAAAALRNKLTLPSPVSTQVR